MKRFSILALALCLAATNLSAQTYIAIPLDNSASNTGQLIPFGSTTSSSFDESRSHFFIPAAYLPGAGGIITAIELIPLSSGTNTLTYELFELSMDHTMNPGLSTTFANNLTNPMVVHNLVNQSIVWAGGWNTITLQTPFLYDGASNLVLQVRKIIDRPNNPPAASTSHRITAWPRRTDLVPPIWNYGTHGSGASAAAAARTTYSTEVLMRFQFANASTLVIDSTRDTTGNSNRPYFHVGATVTATTLGPAGAPFATFFEVGLQPAGIPIPGINGEFWLTTPLYALASGTLDPSGRGVLSSIVPQGAAGVRAYMQSIVIGPGIDLSNVVVAPLAAY